MNLRLRQEQDLLSPVHKRLLRWIVSLELREAGVLLYDKTTIKQQTEEERHGWIDIRGFAFFIFCDIIFLYWHSYYWDRIVHPDYPYSKLS